MAGTTIHTNGAFKGFYQPVGKASFYLNGGRIQPGCGSDWDGVCSHARSVIYFAEAISSGKTNNFIPYKCEDYSSLKDDKCSVIAQGIYLASEDNFGNAYGIYSIKTHSSKPYAIGIIDNNSD